MGVEIVDRGVEIGKMSSVRLRCRVHFVELVYYVVIVFNNCIVYLKFGGVRL